MNWKGEKGGEGLMTSAPRNAPAAQQMASSHGKTPSRRKRRKFIFVLILGVRASIASGHCHKTQIIHNTRHGMITTVSSISMQILCKWASSWTLGVGWGVGWGKRDIYIQIYIYMYLYINGATAQPATFSCLQPHGNNLNLWCQFHCNIPSILSVLWLLLLLLPLLLL